jgi:hypothetical protein
MGSLASGGILVAKSKKPKLLDWRPAAIYIAIVVAGAAGIIIWERAYEAKQSLLGAPSSSLAPDAVAKRLVESYVGAGTVQSSKLDPKSGVLTMVVKDVVSDKGKTPAERRNLISGEGTLAAQRILGVVAFKQVVLRVAKDGKVIATVRAEPGKRPQTEFAPDLQ